MSPHPTEADREAVGEVLGDLCPRAFAYSRRVTYTQWKRAVEALSSMVAKARGEGMKAAIMAGDAFGKEEVESLRAQLAESEKEIEAHEDTTARAIVERENLRAERDAYRDRWKALGSHFKLSMSSSGCAAVNKFAKIYPLPPTQEVKMEDLCPYHDLGDEFAKCPEDCEVDKS